jgi:hypothetical protein
MSYSDPSTPSGLTFEDINGRLLLIDVLAVEADMPTTFGPKTAIRADIAVLDGDDKGAEYTNTLIFPTLLVRQLERSIGNKVVARLGQGEPKPGQKPPWKLTAASAKEKDTAAKFEASRQQQHTVIAEEDEEPF